MLIGVVRCGERGDSSTENGSILKKMQLLGGFGVKEGQ